ncbi:hypothetical protein [Priestia endophytica]|uniref:hypothetical protein n=1 Tax=Priestia endophytica TaxID=135735 RepID=UPI000DCA529F|nr:hypothetical protein [Priestia endophytica]RAS80758.1 hypothetical protein A4U60_14375 [Priestia endophytica]
MSLKNLKLLINDEPTDLPEWINFAFVLGDYLYSQGFKNNSCSNIVVTLPTEDYFALFVAVGITDKIFSKENQLNSIKEQILNLKLGSRIIYLDNNFKRKEVSVIGFEQNPVHSDELILLVQESNYRNGIPEKDWYNRIILLDEQFENIKRTRLIGANKEIGINSPLLNELYSSEQLSKVAFYPGEAFHIVGNENQLTTLINDQIFLINNRKGTIGDFLFINNLHNNSSYVNGKFLSSFTRNTPNNLTEGVPVLYSNISSYLKQKEHFKKNPGLIILSRTDHEHRIEEINLEIGNNLIQKGHSYITNQIIDYLHQKGQKIPNNIELLAWREKL